MPTGLDNLGTDLSQDHPVSFTYNSQLVSQAALASPEEELAAPSALTGNVKLDHNSQMQCTSCHDPHNDQFGNFLVMDNAGSALCTICHTDPALDRLRASAFRSSTQPRGLPTLGAERRLWAFAIGHCRPTPGSVWCQKLWAPTHAITATAAHSRRAQGVVADCAGGANLLRLPQWKRRSPKHRGGIQQTQRASLAAIARNCHSRPKHHQRDTRGHLFGLP